MAISTSQKKEICCKIAFLGAKNAGKSENLRSILSNTSSELKSGMLHLKPNPRDLPFEFLPLSLPPLPGLHIKLHLYAFSDLSALATDLVLRGLDGVIWVIDSRLEHLTENLRAHQNYKDLLKKHGIETSEIIQVFQYNRRDIANPIDPKILREQFNPSNAPETLAVAHLNEGPMTTLKLMTRKILLRLIPTSV